MSRLKEDFSLKNYNTFGIDAKTRLFGSFANLVDLQDLLKQKPKEAPLLVLGGGSNILFTKDFDGVTLKNNFKGIETIREDDNYFFVKAGAGEVWHELVMHCIDNEFAGIENLSLIPGSVGASPMQNIGAYGVEIKDVFHSLEAFHLPTGEVHTFDKEQCQFGYRESVFKRKLKGQYIIISVTYRLKKQPEFKTSYGAIEQELDRMNISDLSIRAISDAVISIRSSKLPNPKEIGNAGSFFKNPVISKELANTLKEEYPNIPQYPANDGIKLAAGWLIEQAGWKGKTYDNYGVHKNQALVLVNYGGATGKQVYDLSEEILQSVKEKFGVQLEREVNII